MYMGRGWGEVHRANLGLSFERSLNGKGTLPLNSRQCFPFDIRGHGKGAGCVHLQQYLLLNLDF